MLVSLTADVSLSLFQFGDRLYTWIGIFFHKLSEILTPLECLRGNRFEPLPRKYRPHPTTSAAGHSSIARAIWRWSTWVELPSTSNDNPLLRKVCHWGEKKSHLQLNFANAGFTRASGLVFFRRGAAELEGGVILLTLEGFVGNWLAARDLFKAGKMFSRHGSHLPSDVHGKNTLTGTYWEDQSTATVSLLFYHSMMIVSSKTLSE